MNPFARKRAVQKPEPESLLLDVGGQALADLLAPAFMDFAIPDCCSFSPTEWLRIWYVREWPHALADRQWQRLVGFAGDLRASLFLDPLAPGAVGRHLNSRPPPSARAMCCARCSAATRRWPSRKSTPMCLRRNGACRSSRSPSSI